MRNRVAAVSILIALAVAPALLAQRHRGVSSGPASGDAFGMAGARGAAVAGTVSGVQGTVITLGSGGAPPIRIEAGSAKVIGEMDGALTLSDVTPGSRITAFIADVSIALAGAPLPAKLVVLDARPDLMVTGAIDSIDRTASTLTVLGITLSVDAETRFETTFPTYAPVDGLEDLAPGSMVQVRADIDGSKLVADRIVVLSPSASPTTILSGTVASISATRWTLTGKDGKEIVVLLDAQTKIVGKPEVGDRVQVVAQLDSSSSYVAVLIIVMEMPGGGMEAQFRGWVQSISATQWTVGGPPGSMAPSMLVKITSATVIYPSPKVGDKVLVTGSKEMGGAFTATKIEKVD